MKRAIEGGIAFHQDGIVVTFLAILELAKEQLLDVVQNEPLAPLYIKSLAARA